MRIRTFVDSTVTGSERDYYFDGVKFAFDRQIGFTKSKTYNACRDVVTPNFRKLINNGVIINNDFTLISSEVHQSPAVVQSSGTCYGESHSFRRVYPLGNISNSGIYLPIKDSFLAADLYVEEYSGDLAMLLQEAHSKVRINEAMALASLGELPETIEWLARILRKGIKVARLVRNKRLLSSAIRYRNSATLGSTSNDLGNLWMEARYAFRPLVYEAIQCISAMKAIVARSLRQTARSRKIINETVELDVTTTQDFVFTLHHKVTNQHILRAGVLFKVEDDINGILALWGLDQPFQTAYELTPLSFVLDWFFNIGDIVGAWAPKAGISTLASWTSASMIIRGTYELVGFRDLDPGRCSSSNGLSLVVNPHISYLTVIKKRYPNPPLSITPHCKLNLSLAKIVDLAQIGRNLLQR